MVAASAGHSGLRLERSSPTAGGALSPVGQSPGQAWALVVVLREESGRSRGPRRPEFPKTGRDDSAHLPRLARPEATALLPPRGGRGVRSARLLVSRTLEVACSHSGVRSPS